MLKHFFLPHSETHKKAHLISWQALAAYLFIFVFLQFSLGFINEVKPGVLGISSGITQQEIVNLTNQQRQKYGLEPLIEDERLNKAAYAKALNMFAENYWAHYSPSGKDPWSFINGAGYQFSYAGENLARNFYTSDEVVKAWMNSPTHKANIINSNYQNIGIAVVEGVLSGQKTTLVVQEFGSPADYVASAPKLLDQQAYQPITYKNDSYFLGVETKTKNLRESLTDPFLISRALGIFLVTWIMLLLLIDYIVLKKRAVVRVGSRHLPHFAVLSAAASALFNMSPGGIL